MAEEDQHPDSEGEGIHLPAPTWGPPLLGLGTGLTLAGLAIGGPILVLAGAAIGAVGVGVWLRDSAREAALHG